MAISHPASFIAATASRGGVAMQNVVLAALLAIDDELHGDTRVLRPAGERRGSPVADHVARIPLVRHPQLPR